MLLSREEVETIKRDYPVGTRIELKFLDDPYVSMGKDYQKGQKGTVVSVDDAGTLHMDWDSGQRLGLIPGEDDFNII